MERAEPEWARMATQTLNVQQVQVRGSDLSPQRTDDSAIIPRLAFQLAQGFAVGTFLHVWGNRGALFHAQTGREHTK